MLGLLWLVFLVFVVLWLVGLFAVHWGAFVWAFLVIAAIILLFNLFTGSRAGRWY
jgi:hypothetical protein